MRLSKLSDRQLRRLIRNADVRFGMADEGLKDFMQTCVKIKKLFSNGGLFREYKQGLQDVDKLGFKIPPEAVEIAKLGERINALLNDVGRKIGK